MEMAVGRTLGVAFGPCLCATMAATVAVDEDRKLGSINRSRHLNAVFDWLSLLGHGTSVVHDSGCCVTHGTRMCRNNKIYEQKECEVAETVGLNSEGIDCQFRQAAIY